MTLRARMRPIDLAAHRDFLGIDFAMDFGLLADHQADAAHIAFDPAVDLDVAGGGEGAGDRHVGADDGGRGTRAGALGGGRGRRPAGWRLTGGLSLLLLENMAARLYEVVRVFDDVVVPDFVMDMRAGAAAGGADPAQARALCRAACPTCTLIADRWP